MATDFPVIKVCLETGTIVKSWRASLSILFFIIEAYLVNLIFSEMKSVNDWSCIFTFCWSRRPKIERYLAFGRIPKPKSVTVHLIQSNSLWPIFDQTNFAVCLPELWVALTRTALHCNEVGNLIVLPHSRKWLSQPLTESYSRTYTYGVSWGPTVTWFLLTWFPLTLHCNKVWNLIAPPHSRKWLSQPLTESCSRTYPFGVSWGPTVTWFLLTWFPLTLHCNKAGNPSLFKKMAFTATDWEL